jgi:hypothetical protein
MVLHSGERWLCTNPNCGCSVVVDRGTAQDGANPRCSCGSILKKEFKPPVLSYLDFLRLDLPLVATKETKQD